MALRAIKSLQAIFLIAIATACVDRVYLDLETFNSFIPVIEGVITIGQGPHYVALSKAYDVEAKQSNHVPITVKNVVITDNLGNSAQLSQRYTGYYFTNYGAITGIAGRSYKVFVELLDGRSYTSKLDTLYSSGRVNKVYFEYKQYNADQGKITGGFDVFFDAQEGSSRNHYYRWDFVGTYKSDISCCTCWTPIFSDSPVVSDGQFIADGQFKHLMVGHVPVNAWTFMYKVHAQVIQRSLSGQSFAFWKAVADQKTAIGSLFQPVSGRIPEMFEQLKGAPAPALGIFYATAIARNSVFIHREDVPNPTTIPKPQIVTADGNGGNGNYIPPSQCTDFFPNSTPFEPPFWVE